MLPAYLEIEENDQIHVRPLDQPRYTIGRLPDRNLYFDYPDVSREHALIEFIDGQFILRDCGSTFGTFVNERQVAVHTLRDGDCVRVGPSSSMQFIFRLGHPPPEEQTKPIYQPSSALHQIRLLLAGLTAMGSGRGLDEVLTVVVDSAIELTGAERGFVMLANPAGELDRTLGRTREKATLGGEEIVTSRSIPERVFREGRPQYEEDLRRSGDQHGPTLGASIQSVLCVPLRLARTPGSRGAQETRTIGVLYVDSSGPRRILSQSARAALDVLADEAALSIELYKESMETLRVEHDLQAAAAVQRNLFPDRLHVSGPFEVAGETKPCLTVGGDFIDYFEAGDGLFVFAEADVSGKGLPAAILAAQTQGIFSTGAQFATSPGEWMRQMNRALSRRPLDGKFVTMACATLASDGRLVVARAGHNPALVLRANGTIETLDGGGFPLGVSDCTYGEQSARLAPGELVIIYSDGVNESVDTRGEQFGMERVYDCLRACRNLPASRVLECFFQAVNTFSADAPQADDITVLVVRYLGAPA